MLHVGGPQVLIADVVVITAGDGRRLCVWHEVALALQTGEGTTQSEIHSIQCTSTHFTDGQGAAMMIDDDGWLLRLYIIVRSYQCALMVTF